MNKWVSFVLDAHGFATLRLDLEHQKNGLHQKFQFDLMAQRLELATQWLIQQPALASLRFGYFGVSIGAGAAIKASALWRRESVQS